MVLLACDGPSCKLETIIFSSLTFLTGDSPQSKQFGSPRLTQGKV
jgi:hypothetical protein